jgi:uncharacterized coiled-coil DUF342 family protein
MAGFLKAIQGLRTELNGNLEQMQMNTERNMNDLVSGLSEIVKRGFAQMEQNSMNVLMDIRSECFKGLEELHGSVSAQLAVYSSTIHDQENRIVSLSASLEQVTQENKSLVEICGSNAKLISGIQERQEDVLKGMKTLAAGMDGKRCEVQNVASKIETVVKRVEDVGDVVKQLKPKLDANDEEVQRIVSQIEELREAQKGQLESMAEGFQKFTAAISDNSSICESLDSRMEEVEQTLLPALDSLEHSAKKTAQILVDDSKQKDVVNNLLSGFATLMESMTGPVKESPKVEPKVKLNFQIENPIVSPKETVSIITSESVPSAELPSVVNVVDDALSLRPDKPLPDDAKTKNVIPSSWVDDVQESSEIDGISLYEVDDDDDPEVAERQERRDQIGREEADAEALEASLRRTIEATPMELRIWERDFYKYKLENPPDYTQAPTVKREKNERAVKYQVRLNQVRRPFEIEWEKRMKAEFTQLRGPKPVFQ